MGGAKWLKADLHMHAPGIGQYFTMPGGEHVPIDKVDRDKFAQNYVRQAREVAGLDMIAITNHNDTSWIEPLRKGARELYGDEFVVLPGLEIGADSGLASIHILAIFPENTTVEQLERLLDEDLGLTKDRRFDDSGAPLPTSKSFADTVEAIKEKRNGIAIAAHAFSSEDSLLGSASNRGITRKNQFLHPCLSALDLGAFTLQQLAEKNSRWGFWVVTNQHRDGSFHRKRPIALLNNSDARKLEELGTQFTWLKGMTPCFSTLKNAIANPEDRVRLRTNPPPGEELWKKAHNWIYVPPQKPTSYLKRVDVQDTPTGFLRELSVSFHPGFNCLIGGRGSGKSALIELIRYLWDLQSLYEEEIKGFEEVFLPETGIASIEVVADGANYRVVRHGRNKPFVERLSPEGWARIDDLTPEQLLQVNVYGQKEILYTSRDLGSQLELLDRLVGSSLEEVKREQRRITEQLQQNRNGVVGDYERHQRILEELEELPKIREKLRNYHSLGIEDKAEHKKKFDREEAIWRNVEQRLEDTKDAISTVRKSRQLGLNDLEQESVKNLPNRPLLQQVHDKLDQLSEQIEVKLEELASLRTEAAEEIQTIREQWKLKYEKFNEGYRSALSKLPGVTPDHIVKLEKRSADLERKEQELAELEAQIKEKLKQRRKLLANLLATAKKKHLLRAEKAEEISNRLTRVRVKVNQGGNSDELADYLQQNFRVPRMRKEHYSILSTSVEVSVLPLLALVEQADSETPKSFHGYQGWLPEIEPEAYTGLDDNWFSKLVDRLDFKARLTLDEFMKQDQVSIEVNIARDDQSDKWRPLGRKLGQGVSVGQGCTAILSIILLESTHPLIIDQPEDDLDNRFIYEEVVHVLRRERGRRQIILATHNANLPVGGDAEMIVALDTEEVSDDQENGLKCVAAATGFVDDPDVRYQVTSVLEGGEEAFRVRRRRYGF